MALDSDDCSRLVQELSEMYMEVDDHKIPDA